MLFIKVLGTRELDGFLDAICANQPLNFLFQGRYVDFSEFFRKLKVNSKSAQDNTSRAFLFDQVKRSVPQMALTHTPKPNR